MIESFITPTVGATGLLAVVVGLILLGKLVPKSSVDDMRRDKDQQIQLWHQAYENTVAANNIERENAKSLFSLAESVMQYLDQRPNE